MSWKESKIFIAVSSCAATAVFLITVFFTVVIPTWLESYRNEIKELKKTIPDYSEIVKKLNEKEKEILGVKAELNALRLDKIFYNLDPYPVGFREVQLGDNLSKVRKVYEKATINEDSPDRIKVPIEHNLFSDITFFVLPYSDDKGKIDMIIFNFKDPGRLSYETLKKKIGETFPRKEYTETISKSNRAKLMVKGFFDRIRVEVNEIGMHIDHE